MLKKLLTQAVAPLPAAANIMGVVCLLAVFTAGYGVGVAQAGGAIGTWADDDGAAGEAIDDGDLSAEMIAAGEAGAAEAKAKAAGVEKVLMTALWDGVLIPALVIGGQIAEIGAGIGYWLAATFGLAVAEAVGNALAVSMLGIAAYDVATDIRDAEVSA